MAEFLKKVIPLSKECIEWLEKKFAAFTHSHDQYTTPQQVSSLISASGGQFPDWKNVIGLSPNTGYTAATNGYLMIGVAGGNGTRMIATNINGTYIEWYGDSGAYQYGWGCMQVFLPIKKGCSYSFGYNSGNQGVRFALFVGC